MNVQMNIFSTKEIRQLRDIKLQLDRIEESIEDLKKLFLPYRYLPVELEKAVRKVSKSANVIDLKVEDLE